MQGNLFLKNVGDKKMQYIYLNIRECKTCELIYTQTVIVQYVIMIYNHN